MLAWLFHVAGWSHSALKLCTNHARLIRLSTAHYGYKAWYQLPPSFRQSSVDLCTPNSVDYHRTNASKPPSFAEAPAWSLLRYRTKDPLYQPRTIDGPSDFSLHLATLFFVFRF